MKRLFLCGWFGVVGCDAAEMNRSAPDTGSAPRRDAGSTIPGEDSGALPVVDAGMSGRIDSGGGAMGELLFFDDFEYEVGRDVEDKVSIFQTEGGWSWMKSMPREPGALGYIFTADAIPGYDGAFPGGGGRVLSMEVRSGTHDGQTDMYLQIGGEDAPDDTIPGNVWFQMWIYVPHTDEQPSQWGGGKFLYPCRTFYPCTTGNWNWLVTMGTGTYPPHNAEPFGNPSNGEFFVSNIASTDAAEVNNMDAPEWDRWKLGQTNIDEAVRANRWTLVKIHVDTSGASGAYEMWHRPLHGAWVKTTEWIDGVTERFVWQIMPEYQGGHRVLRMPTTLGQFVEGRPNYDAWLYMDDFAMATGEDALPVYADAP